MNDNASVKAKKGFHLALLRLSQSQNKADMSFSEFNIKFKMMIKNMRTMQTRL